MTRKRAEHNGSETIRLRDIQLRAVDRSELPRDPNPELNGDFWDWVIQEVLFNEEAYVVEFHNSDHMPRWRKAAYRAGRRAGVKVSVAVRGVVLYLWVAE